MDGSIKTEKFTEKDFSSNNWICKWRTDYNYDINGLLQSKLYSAWVIDSNMLVEYKIEEFTYNSFGKVDTYIDKRLNHNTLVWKDHRKTIYTYNDINQDSIILFLELDLATDSLINFNRREYFHNSNGFDKIDILSHWFKSQNQWRFESKVESNYDSSGKRIFIISSIWHSDLSWHQFYKREYVYDYNENLSIYQYYTQTDSTGWYLTQENDYNYDYNFTISECYFQTHESSQIEYWNHMYNIPTDYVIQYVNDGELYELIRLTYYYSDINIGIPEEISNEIIVFPNPTNGKLLILNETYIELDEFRIYNQLGQLVMHKNIISNSIDLSSFIQGIYVIEFVVENMRIRRKIIIK